MTWLIVEFTHPWAPENLWAFHNAFVALVPAGEQESAAGAKYVFNAQSRRVRMAVPETVSVREALTMLGGQIVSEERYRTGAPSEPDHHDALCAGAPIGNADRGGGAEREQSVDP